LKARLAKHNAGDVTHTKKFGPWLVKNYFAFADKEKAFAFETYFKSGSGRAFAKKHF
jgi:putative endonuclease